MNETPLLPWVIMTNTGDVIAAHCDCMAGLAQTSTHVAALLFKVKAVVRIRQKTTLTGVAAYWMVPSIVDKVKPTVGLKTHYISAAA